MARQNIDYCIERAKATSTESSCDSKENAVAGAATSSVAGAGAGGAGDAIVAQRCRGWRGWRGGRQPHSSADSGIVSTETGGSNESAIGGWLFSIKGDEPARNSYY